jgi:hypothetical protein
VKKHHDELIATIRYYIPLIREDFPHHVDLINEVVASLERKKHEVEKKAAKDRAEIAFEEDNA